MITSNEIKKMIGEYGVDLCGVASIRSFDEAPQGYHPCDVLPSCKSVIVFGKKFLNSTMKCTSTTPYTIVRNILSEKMDRMAVQICTELENKGIVAIPTGTNGPTEYDLRTKRYRNSVSAKHCALKAGLGMIGRNTLLVTPKFGNMVWLSVILVDIELEADEMMLGSPCPDGCSLCVDICPARAVGKPELDQMACWNYAYAKDNGGDFKINCFKCREVCPNCFNMEK